jgi:hypothetical protein
MGWSTSETCLEIGTIEGALRVDDHEADGPFEESLLVNLGSLLAHQTIKEIRGYLLRCWPISPSKGPCTPASNAASRQT